MIHVDYLDSLRESLEPQAVTSVEASKSWNRSAKCARLKNNASLRTAMAIKRNVQQQNAIAREEITRRAMAFRDQFAYPWLHVELQSRGLDPWGGVLADLKTTPEQDGEFVEGIWLASGPRFFRFTALISTRSTDSAEIETWEDTTDATEINAHCPGTGKSFGWLAVEVFREITGRG